MNSIDYKRERERETGNGNWIAIGLSHAALLVAATPKVWKHQNITEVCETHKKHDQHEWTPIDS